MFRLALPCSLDRPRLSVGVGAIFLLFAALTLRGQQPTVAPTATPLSVVVVAAGTPAMSFFVPRATLWLGRSMVLPFRLAQASAGDLTVAASVADPSAVEILRPPVVLAGETTGFLRLRGLHVGKTRLTIHGDVALDLEIKTDPAAVVFSSIDAESGRPRIVSPVPDAAVWGQFAVGVPLPVRTPAPMPPRRRFRPRPRPRPSRRTPWRTAV